MELGAKLVIVCFLALLCSLEAYGKPKNCRCSKVCFKNELPVGRCGFKGKAVMCCRRRFYLGSPKWGWRSGLSGGVHPALGGRRFPFPSYFGGPASVSYHAKPKLGKRPLTPFASGIGKKSGGVGPFGTARAVATVSFGSSGAFPTGSVPVPVGSVGVPARPSLVALPASPVTAAAAAPSPVSFANAASVVPAAVPTAAVSSPVNLITGDASFGYGPSYDVGDFYVGGPLYTAGFVPIGKGEFGIGAQSGYGFAPSGIGLPGAGYGYGYGLPDGGDAFSGDAYDRYYDFAADAYSDGFFGGQGYTGFLGPYSPNFNGLDSGKAKIF